MRIRGWVEANPLHWPLASWALTFGGFGAGELLIRQFGWGGVMPVVLPGLVFPAALAPFVAMAALALSYCRNAQSLGRIVSLYVALILLCANINFILVLHFGQNPDALPFHGMQPVWEQAGGGRPPPFLWGNALRAAVDCLHFSVVTLSTVGYGDVNPIRWYSKLAVDAQILMGLGVTVLTVGRYFARGGESGRGQG